MHGGLPFQFPQTQGLQHEPLAFYRGYELPSTIAPSSVSLASSTGSVFATKRDSVVSLASSSSGSSASASGSGGLSFGNISGRECLSVNQALTDEELLDAAIAAEEHVKRLQHHHQHQSSISSSASSSLSSPASSSFSARSTATTASSYSVSPTDSDKSHVYPPYQTSVNQPFTLGAPPTNSKKSAAETSASASTTKKTTDSTSFETDPALIPRAFMRPNAVRASQACVACRKRKVRCVPLPPDHPAHNSSSHNATGGWRKSKDQMIAASKGKSAPLSGGQALGQGGKCCTRCTKIGIDCVWAEERRGKRNGNSGERSVTDIKATSTATMLNGTKPAIATSRPSLTLTSSASLGPSSSPSSASSSSTTPRQSLTSSTSSNGSVLAAVPTVTTASQQPGVPGVGSGAPNGPTYMPFIPSPNSTTYTPFYPTTSFTQSPSVQMMNANHLRYLQHVHHWNPASNVMPSSFALPQFSPANASTDNSETPSVTTPAFTQPS